MPFTLFHFGPALLLGLLSLNYLHFMTFIVANVIVDVEPLLVLIFDLNYPLHGFFHSFLGGFIIGVCFSVFMFLLYSHFPLLRKLFFLDYGCSSLRGFISAGVLGVFIHILFDSPLYSDIRPFFPLTVNPFYNPSITSSIYFLCVVMFLLGLFLYFVRIVWRKL